MLGWTTQCSQYEFPSTTITDLFLSTEVAWEGVITWSFLKDVSKIIFVNLGISGNVMLDPVWMPMSTKAVLTLPSWAGQGRKNVIKNQDKVRESSLSNCPHREDKEISKSHHAEKNCNKKCTCWWLKYCCGLSVGKSSGVLVTAFPSELHPGGERNQMLWKTKVVWSGAVANSSCNNRAVAFQILISQKNLYQILQPRGQEGF